MNSSTPVSYNGPEIVTIHGPRIGDEVLTSQTAQQIAVLDTACREAYDFMSKLAAKLAPVSHPSKGTPVDTSTQIDDAAVELVPLAEQIYTCTQNVRRVTAFIKDILNRLEV